MVSCHFSVLWCLLVVYNSWCISLVLFFLFHFFGTTQLCSLSLHDALPIFPLLFVALFGWFIVDAVTGTEQWWRSEEHTSELQSRGHLVCRLLLEKKKKN